MPVASFVGRRSECASLAALLTEERLVTVSGMGGIGKTRLVLEMARTGAFDRLGEQVWVDLTGARNAADVDAAMLAALELTGQSGMPVAEVISESLAAETAVLLLDNCEQVASAAGTVAQAILRRCRGLRILATSRAELGVPGEHVWRLAPLPVDGPDGALSDAERLFVARARACGVRPLTGAEPRAVIAGICRQLEGVPLAIELAAAHLRSASLEEIQERLADRLGLLVDGPALAPAHQRALRASLDWSYGLIAPPARTLLRRLSVFAEGWTAEGMRAVCSGGELEPAQLDPLLDELVRNSLVMADTGEAVSRFRLAGPVQQYAAERLEEAGEADAVRDRHLAHVTALAARADEELWTVHPAQRALLDRESAEVAAALAHAGRTRQTAALEIAGHLTPYWLQTGRLEVGRTAVDQALAALPDAPPHHLALAQAMGGWLNYFLGDGERAGELLSAAQATLARCVAPRAAAWAGGLKASMASVVDPVGAREPLEQVCEQARAVDDRLLLAGILLGIALVDDARDDAQALSRSARATATAADAIGDRIERQWATLFLARQELLAGRLDSCVRHVHAILSVKETPAVEVRWTALALEAVARARGGELPLAHELIERAAGLVGRRSGWIGAPNVLYARAVAALVEGRLQRAREFAEQALSWPRGGVQLMVQGHELLLHAALAVGDRGSVDAAAATLRDAGQRFANGRAQALAQYGDAASALLAGDFGRTLTLGVGTLRRQLDGGWQPGAIDTLELLARADLARGRADRAAVLAGAAGAARARCGLVRGWPASPELAELEQHARAGTLVPQTAEAWAAGGRLTLPGAVEYVSRGRGSRGRPQQGLDSLTPSERAVATLAAAGLTTPAIAEQLVVSRDTVKTHLSRVYAKLGVSGRTALAAKIARIGDVPPPPRP